MIAIARGLQPATIKAYVAKTVKALDGVTRVTRAEREIEQATAFFTNPAHYANEKKLTGTSFTFAVYKDPELVDALEAIFGNKCAYCESSFAHVTPRDIEHFRPKSEITAGDSTLRPGYFWLASDWDNLLVSCPDCNRLRKHRVPGQPDKVRLGKETQFPLADEKQRVRNRQPLAAEEPVRLLLNPCTDRPELHLTFDDQGLVRARENPPGQPSAMGDTSIAVYALQRKALVEERLRVLNQFKLAVSQLDFLVGNHNTLKAAGLDTAANGAQIAATTAHVHDMLSAKASFLGMLREWIARSHARGDLDHLRQFGIDLTTLI